MANSKDNIKDALDRIHAIKGKQSDSLPKSEAKPHWPVDFTSHDSVDSVNTDEASEEPMEVTDSNDDSLDPDVIQKIADGVRQQTLAAFQAERDELDKQADEQRAKLDELQKELEEKDRVYKDAIANEKAKQKQLTEIFYKEGYQAGVMPVYSVSDNTQGTPYITRRNRFQDAALLKEYKNTLEKAGGFTIHTPSGQTLLQKDMREGDRFYKEHRDGILRAVESEMKSKGYLKGGIASRDNTTPGDLPYAFLDIAAAEVRMTHHEDTIYWQFARRMTDPSISVEQTGRFPRLEYGAIGESPDDYFLGSTVTSLQTDTEALRASSVPIEVKELGLGRPGTVLKPISVSEIITSNSIFDAIGAVNIRLGKSFNRGEDHIIRSLIHSTSRGGYVSNDTLVETDAEVAGGGQITQKFLSYLYGYMSAQNIPPLSDGCYFLTMPPQAFAVLRQDLIDRQRFIEAPSVEGILNVMREYHGDANLKRNSGYQGKIEGFHVFQANSYGTGVPGAVGAAGEGVETETLNGTAVTTRACYAFGIDTVGVLESMPFTIRQRSENTFGRYSEFIWLQHAGYGALDIDPLRTRLGFETPGDTTSEQLRVFEIKSADLAV